MRPTVLAAGLALAACSPRADTGAQRAESTDSLPVPDGPYGGGTILGIVRFVGAAPDNPIIDMRTAPACRAVYHSVPRQLSVVVNPNRTLANVFVYVRQGLPASSDYAVAPDSVLVTQRGCQYHPRVFGLMVGQTLMIRNDDIVAHAIETVGVKTQRLTLALPAGRKTAHVFRSAEVMVPFGGRTHRWMRAYAGIVSHPFFATTGDDGRFTIGRLPSGTYTLEAWHEGYGRRTATVTVRDSTTQHVTFTYSQTFSETSE